MHPVQCNIANAMADANKHVSDLKRISELKPLDEVLKLPTPRLLAFFKKHRKQRFAYLNKYYDNNCKPQHDQVLTLLELYFDTIKDELNTREHVE